MKVRLFWIKYFIGGLGIYILVREAPTIANSLKPNIDLGIYVPWILVGLLSLIWIVFVILLVKLKVVLFHFILLFISFIGFVTYVYGNIARSLPWASLVNSIANILIGLTMINVMVHPNFFTFKCRASVEEVKNNRKVKPEE